MFLNMVSSHFKQIVAIVLLPRFVMILPRKIDQYIKSEQIKYLY